MSIQLKPVDLSTAIVGTAGSIPLGQSMPPATIGQQMRPTQTAGATLVLFNESGAGLQCTFPSSMESFTVPGGGWRQVAVPPGETALNYVVQYILPGANVSLFLVDLYLPGEAPDSIGVLGNSPIGVGGSVTTSTTSAVKQDGSGPGTSLIEATPSDQLSSSWAMNNDASGNISVLSAGVLRDILRVVRGNSGVGKATVTIGDAGDTTILTLLGQLAAALVQAGALNIGVGMGQAPGTAGFPGPRFSIHSHGSSNSDIEADVSMHVVSGSGSVILSDNAYYDNVHDGVFVTSGPAKRVLVGSDGKVTYQASQDASPTAGNPVTWGGTTQLIPAIFQTTQPANPGGVANAIWVNTGL